MATGVLFGLAPAFQSGRDNRLTRFAKAAEAVRPAQAVAVCRPSLVMGELALALMLVTSAGLLVRSFVLLAQVNSGSQAPLKMFCR